MAVVSAFLDDLPLDVSNFTWPIYRGTTAKPGVFRVAGERWDDVQQWAAEKKGGPSVLALTSPRGSGASSGPFTRELQNIYTQRIAKLNDSVCEITCFDSRILLSRFVGDADYNMKFAGNYQPGTRQETYKSAIEDFVERVRDFLGFDPVADDAFESIPDRELEDHVRLSAWSAPDPLAYLCDRAGVDLVVEPLSGQWYFASRADASEGGFFQGWNTYRWTTRPGFIDNDAVALQRPKIIKPFSWEIHGLKLFGGRQSASFAPPRSGPIETQVELEQVFLWEGKYLTVLELQAKINLSLVENSLDRGFLSQSGKGSSLHPADSTQVRRKAWQTIQRDYRTLWRINYLFAEPGAWLEWRFGKLLADGSIDPTSVECESIEFKATLEQAPGQSVLGRPWTFNRGPDECPFIAVWDDGPESGVIRLVSEPDETALRPPVPGSLLVDRDINGGVLAPGTPSIIRDTALRYVFKDGLATGDSGNAFIPELELLAREDISNGYLAPFDGVTVFMVARRNAPNDNTRWHAEEVPAFTDGEIDEVQLPPGEVEVYRNADLGVEADGLGLIMNEDEVVRDGQRRAEVWKLIHQPAVTGEGVAKLLSLLNVDRLVDGPVQEAAVEFAVGDNHAQTCSVRVVVGNLADPKARTVTAEKRLDKRQRKSEQQR